MKNTIQFLLIAFVSLLIFSCEQPKKKEAEVPTEHVITKVLTKKEQQALTPDIVSSQLAAGNQRFVTNNLFKRDAQAMVKDAVSGQAPRAIILSCIDSRVPVEEVFDQGIGDIFVARVAGNISNVDMLGSMEYACRVSGSKLIMVLGHEKCGAVESAIKGVELGNITALLANIKPAIEQSSDFEGEQVVTNPKYVQYVCDNNVRNTIQEIKDNSPILQQMDSLGHIKIVGAVYNLHTGKVTPIK